MTIVEMNVTPEAKPETPAPDMVSMFSAALTEIINKMVDKRVEEILGNVATAKLMDFKLTERIESIVDAKIEAHTCDENHHDIDEAVREAVGELDLDEAVERSFKHSVNWEDYVKDLVEREVAALVDDDHMHDKVREVLNDVTFTVSVD